MDMTCVCTEAVASIVLVPSHSKLIFNVTTTTVLDNGTELIPESKTEEVVLPPTLLAEVLALRSA